MRDNDGFLSKLGSLFGIGRGGSKPPAQPPAAAGPSAREPVPVSAGGAPPTQEPPARAPSAGRVYTGDAPLIRKRYLWGRDNSGNPGFLVLIGEHKTRQGGAQPILEESVTYTDAVIFRGSGGHLPAFEAVRVLEARDYSTRESSRNIYYKRDIGSYGYWADSSLALPDFIPFDSGIEIPYYQNAPHSDIVARVQTHGLQLDNFALVDNPDDILGLDEALCPYREDLVELLSNPNLYTRKKTLKALIAKAPPEALWRLLLERGSSELIAGLFLEFALQRSPLLLTQAHDLLTAPIPWAAESYASGIRRTARLYCTALDERAGGRRLEALRETLPQLRFYPMRMGGRELAADAVVEGAALRKYALQGSLSEYYYEYSRKERKTIRHRREGLYPKGMYSDSTTLDRVALKNTIQECEVYGAADMLGQIAYYLDAPGLVYHLRGSGKSKALRYFQRYLTRIFNGWARTDEPRFIEAMVNLLTGYTPADYCCKFPGNFQFNFFIKYYLYSNLDHTAPDSWYERYRFMQQDQLLQAQGRYEFSPEIWDRHLDQVVEIALRARVDTVLKGVYHILKDPPNQRQLEADSPYPVLADLASSPYAPLAEMGVRLLQNKLGSESGFRAEIMAVLMRSQNPAVQALARDYMQRAGGVFAPEDLAGMLLLPDLAAWQPMIGENLLRLDSAGYIRFLQAVLDLGDALDAVGMDDDSPLGQLLRDTLHRLPEASGEQKAALLRDLTGRLQAELAEPVRELLAKLLFTLPLPELRELLSTPEVELRLAGARPGIMSALLRAVHTGVVPEDEVIVELLEAGSAEMLRAFVALLEGSRDALAARFPTLLLLLECDVAALQELVKSIFESLPAEQQRELHMILLDSPVPAAYSFGLDKLHTLYESRDQFIPEAFIVKMMEHTAPGVRGFIAGKVQDVFEQLGGGDAERFLYYAKTILLLPNRLAGSKDHVYAALPRFVRRYVDKRPQVEALLLEIGGSNVIRDSERALVTLAHLRKEAV